MTAISSIGIVGAGQMGGGIAQLAAQSGINVLIKSSTRESAEACLQLINRRLVIPLRKKEITAEQRQQIMTRITIADSLEMLADCPLIIEAIPEQLEQKLELFHQLDQICRPEAVLATNTSSLSITTLAAATERPERCIGMHYFNPATEMELVEIVEGLATDQETTELVTSLVDSLGKTSIRCRDRAGFIVNRILVPMVNEACFLLDEGTAEIEDIDKAMQLGCHHNIGPLRMADFVGLDTCLTVIKQLQEEMGDKYHPAPILQKYVTAGWLGRKTGRGFYQY